MLLDLLRKRASVRAFRPDPIPSDIIEDMLEAARLSPSGGNEQPWKFGVITSRSRIAEVADACYGQTWIASAPLLAVLCAVITPDARDGRGVLMRRFPAHAGSIAAMPRGLHSALTLEEHQTKIAGAHMALVALEHGIGSTWISLFDVERVARLLHLPPDILPSEMLAFGYPATAPKQKPKKPPEEVAFYDDFQPRIRGD
jgi:nitroreductase